MGSLQFCELWRGRNLFVTNQRKDPLRAVLASRHHSAQFQQSEGRCIGRSALTDDDAGAKRLRCLLQSGGDVHYVAEDRIVEALRRPDISDNAFTCVQAYANAYRNEALALQP